MASTAGTKAVALKARGDRKPKVMQLVERLRQSAPSRNKPSTAAQKEAGEGRTGL